MDFLNKVAIEIANDPTIDAIVRASRHGEPAAILRHEKTFLVLVRVGSSPFSNRFKICDAEGKSAQPTKPLTGLSDVAYFLAHNGWADCQVEATESRTTAPRLTKLLAERRSQTTS